MPLSGLFRPMELMVTVLMEKLIYKGTRTPAG